MDHGEAVRSQAVEKYLLGELDGAARDQFEEHFFDCGACAEDIRTGLLLVDNAAAELRSSRLEAREAAREGKHSSRDWFRFPSWQGALVMPVLALLAVSGFWVRDHRELSAQLKALDEPQAFSNVPLDVSRGEKTASVSRSDRLFAVSFFIDSTDSYPNYEVEISGNGIQPATVNLPRHSPEKSYNILLPVSRYPRGQYRFSVKGGAGSDGRSLAQFTLRLE